MAGGQTSQTVDDWKDVPPPSDEGDWKDVDPSQTADQSQAEPEKPGVLASAWDELKSQGEGLAHSLIPSKDNLYGLAGPTGPLSAPMNALNAMQNWQRRSRPEQTPTGGTLPPRTLPYKMLTGATDLAGLPTGAEGEEEAARQGNSSGVVGHALTPALEAAAPLAGEGLSELAPSREGIARAMRNPETATGSLKPRVANASRIMGAAGGAGAGAIAAHPYGPIGGGILGASLGPRIADFLIPNLSEDALREGKITRGVKNAQVRQSVKDRMAPPQAIAPPLMQSEADALSRTGSAQEPFEPLIYSSPQEAEQLDRRMANLKRQASSAGTYHAAQGAVGRRLNLQQRIARTLGTPR